MARSYSLCLINVPEYYLLWVFFPWHDVEAMHAGLLRSIPGAAAEQTSSNKQLTWSAHGIFMYLGP